MPYALRFMIDTGIVGMSWLTVSKGKYRVRKPSEKDSHCQLEIDIHDFNEVYQNPSSGKFAKIAPLRILSFDIECSSLDGGFPSAEKDPVIQIGNICKIHG